MDELILNKYGNIISDQETGDIIYKDIKNALKNVKAVKVNLNKVKTMATFNAKQIFGRLYIDLGAVNFFEKIIILSANDDLKLIISLGIQSAIDDGN